MVITRTAWTDDDGSGTTGTVLNNAVKTELYNQIDAAIAHPNCSVYNAFTQSIPNNTHTALLFDSEEFDADGLHSTGSNTSRITIPSGMDGKWWFNTCAMWAVNGTGQRLARFYKNGSAWGTVSYAMKDGTYNVTHTFAALISMVATDYVEVFVFQDSGGALAIGAAGTPNPASCRLQAFKVG